MYFEKQPCQVLNMHTSSERLFWPCPQLQFIAWVNYYSLQTSHALIGCCLIWKTPPAVQVIVCRYISLVITMVTHALCLEAFWLVTCQVAATFDSAKFGGPSWMSGRHSGVSVRGRDYSYYRLDRMKRCIMGTRYSFSFMIEWTSVVISKRFQSHILGNWWNLTKFNDIWCLSTPYLDVSSMTISWDAFKSTNQW
jgi:hypothetical protein